MAKMLHSSESGKDASHGIKRRPIALTKYLIDRRSRASLHVTALLLHITDRKAHLLCVHTHRSPRSYTRQISVLLSTLAHHSDTLSDRVLNVCTPHNHEEESAFFSS